MKLEKFFRAEAFRILNFYASFYASKVVLHFDDFAVFALITSFTSFCLRSDANLL